MNRISYPVMFVACPSGVLHYTTILVVSIFTASLRGGENAQSVFADERDRCERRTTLNRGEREPPPSEYKLKIASHLFSQPPNVFSRVRNATVSNCRA